MKNGKRRGYLIPVWGLIGLCLVGIILFGVLGLVRDHREAKRAEQAPVEDRSVEQTKTGEPEIQYETQEFSTEETVEDVDGVVQTVQKRLDFFVPGSKVEAGEDSSLKIFIPQTASGKMDEIASHVFSKQGKLEFLDQENMDQCRNHEEYTALLDNSAIDRAEATVQENGTEKEYVVKVVFTESGKEKFAEITGSMVGEILSVVLDGKEVISPVVQAEIVDGVAIISGAIESMEDAEEIAAILRSGYLPCKYKKKQ